MPTPDHAAVSRPDDPALLRIEGPIATITLNRPAAFAAEDARFTPAYGKLGVSHSFA
jgi:hypothetical protein